MDKFRFELATAKFAQIVDFPTPPFALDIAIIFLTPGIFFSKIVILVQFYL